MKSKRFLTIALLGIVLLLSGFAVLAQEAVWLRVNVEMDVQQNVYADANVESAVVGYVHRGNMVQVIEVSSDEDWAHVTAGAVDGWMEAANLAAEVVGWSTRGPLAIQGAEATAEATLEATAEATAAAPESTPEATPEAIALVAADEPVTATMPLPDMSWMNATVTYRPLKSEIALQNASNGDTVTVGTLNPTTDPVVAVVAVDGAYALVRGATLTGWATQASVDMQATSATPAWASQTHTGFDPDGTCYQVKGIADPGDQPQVVVPQLYAPNGDPLTDLFRVGGNIIGHGTPNTEVDDHFVTSLRYNGEYNPSVTTHGFWMRGQGDAWTCSTGWLTFEPQNMLAQMFATDTHKASIGEEFLVEDAYIHSLIPFNPPYWFGDNDGAYTNYTQEEILDFAQANRVLAEADLLTADPDDVPVLQQDNCPVTPERREAAGELRGLQYYGAFGVSESDCQMVAISINTDTSADAIEVRVWRGQMQNFPYLRNRIALFQMPEEMDEPQLVTWLAQNLPAVATELNLTGRTNVVMHGFELYEEGAVLALSVFGS